MRWLILVALLSLLAGCGQKGPLYLPDDEAAAERYERGEAREDDSEDDSENGN